VQKRFGLDVGGYMVALAPLGLIVAVVFVVVLAEVFRMSVRINTKVVGANKKLRLMYWNVVILDKNVACFLLNAQARLGDCVKHASCGPFAVDGWTICGYREHRRHGVMG
jgi:hypothetical protein